MASKLKVLRTLLAAIFLVSAVAYVYMVALPSASPTQRSSNYTSTSQLPLEYSDPDPTTDLLLEQILKEWTSEQTGDFAVRINELNGERRQAEYQADQQFVSASTYKLFFVYAVLDKIENSDLTLDSMTSLNRTVLDCIDSLLTYSWDICGYPIAQLVGLEEMHQLFVEQGFSDTDLNNYDENGDFNGNKFTTANDEALLLEKLYNGTLLNPEHSELMLDFLKNQKWRERIPAGIPDEIVVADKPGWIFEYENDAAIVYGEKTDYVLVILSNKSSKAKLAELSSVIYDYLQK